LVANAKNFIDFFIKKIIFTKASLREKITEMEEKILPFILDTSDPILKGKFISKIARGFDVKEEFILEALKKVENQIKDEKKREEKNDILELEKFDISTKNGIISDTIKKILRELTAIYFWQKNLPEAERWVNPETILKKIEEFSDEETFKKILNLKEKFINLLILEIQVKFENSTQENFEYVLNSYEKNFELISLDKRISELTKKISFAKDEGEIKKILEEIQNLSTKKHQK